MKWFFIAENTGVCGPNTFRWPKKSRQNGGLVVSGGVVIGREFCVLISSVAVFL